MSISKRLEEIRKNENLSRTKFGLKIGKTEDTIYNLERGRSAITDDLIDLISQTFNINKEWFIYGSGEMYDTSAESLEISDTISKLIDSKDLSDLVTKLTKLSDDKIKVLNDLVDLMHSNEK